MIYNIVHPYAMAIPADSFGEAVKNYVKINHDLSVRELIITDQIRNMKANLEYYNKGNRKKVSISLSPTTLPLDIKDDGQIISPLNSWPYSPSISYDTKEYPSTTFIPGISYNPLGPLGPLGSISPLGFGPFGPLRSISPLGLGSLGPLSSIAPLGVGPFGYGITPNLASNVRDYYAYKA
jgi:hypothetical protein